MVNMNMPKEELLKAFNAVEGDGWAERLVTEDERMVVWARENGKDYQTHFTSIAHVIKKKEFTGCECIYGSGGFNRYFVRKDGSVDFSSMHAMYPNDKTIEKARSAGFEII